MANDSKDLQIQKAKKGKCQGGPFGDSYHAQIHTYISLPHRMVTESYNTMRKSSWNKGRPFSLCPPPKAHWLHGSEASKMCCVWLSLASSKLVSRVLRQRWASCNQSRLGSAAHPLHRLDKWFWKAFSFTEIYCVDETLSLSLRHWHEVLGFKQNNNWDKEQEVCIIKQSPSSCGLPHLPVAVFQGG